METTHHDSDDLRAPTEVGEVGTVDEGPPTLGEAFACVRAALEGVFVDNLPALAECELIQALHNDGNVGVAWRRAVLLLEMAVNAPLRQ